MGARQGFLTLGRLAFAVAAWAVMCAALGAGPARSAEPKAVLDGDMKPALRSEILGAIGDTDRPISNRFEARRRAREAGEDAIAVLRAEGYYAYDVEPDVTEADPPRPVVKVAPGKRFVIADPTIEWVGSPPTAEVQQAGEAVMGLANGQAGRAADVIGAEGRIVAAVQKRGYADVVTAPRVVTVDHADGTVRPDFKIVAATGFSPDQIAFVGDDLFDIPILERVGFSATVPHAVDPVKERVHYITEFEGGDGAVREVSDAIRRAQGHGPY